VPALITLLIVVAAAAAIAVMSPRGSSSAATSVAAVWHAAAASAGAATATAPAAAPEPAAQPSPVFASFRGVRLHLPVAAAAITVLAFHQSSFNDSYQMKPLVKPGSVTAAAAVCDAEKAAGVATPQDLPGGTERPEATSKGVWTGTALELWRGGRGGKTYTAIDCGAHPGTPVCSPVNGTVMYIRRYKLYGKTDDLEVHIKPDAWSDVDVVILHVTDPTIEIGQHVIGGLTPIAHVRRLSGLVSGLQLRTYSPDGGNHTHVQINRIAKPNQPWTVGQDPPGLVRQGD
jgi:hypothetical protein